MKKWTLIRKSNQQVVHEFIQLKEPTDEFIAAFGSPSDFDLVQDIPTTEEIDNRREHARSQHYPHFKDLMLAIYFKEKGNDQPMKRLVALIDLIRAKNV